MSQPFANAAADLGAVRGSARMALGVSFYILHCFLKIGWLVIDHEVIDGGSIGKGG